MSEPGDWIPADLLAVTTMTLATVGEDGIPHAVDVYFAAGTGKLPPFYFYSQADTQHGRDLASRPQAAATIHPLVADWQAIHGVQIRGTAQLITDKREGDHAFVLYVRKFAFALRLKALLTTNEMFVFRPTWVRVIDNRRGFGFKEEKGITE
jgi:uncharacterized protein YhbP (UPF0306 family)